MALKKKTTRTARKAASRKAGGRARRAAPSRGSAKRAPARASGSGRGASGNGGGAGKALVIVESPAKAKTISRYLGNAYRVRATVGHVRDLPEKKLGIDIERGFEPEYVTIPGKEKTVAELKLAAKEARAIYLATDPDREGEAIAWHVASSIKGRNTPTVRRVLFNEITREAVQRAMEEAGDIDEHKVDAQQARRVLDRLVGYKASPILWKTVRKGISAGRVQTVALRLLVEREREIRAFNPVEYWSIEALLREGEQEFTARLHAIDDAKPVIPNEEAAQRILAELSRWKKFPVSEVKRRERRKNPAAPFTTSTLQQEAAKRLGYGARKTMQIAQRLYEGVELGKEGAVGLITYMRTDSTRVSEGAAGEARRWLEGMFGSEFVARTPMLYGSTRGNARTQDAHEAIRPTDPTRRPDQIKRDLTPDQFRLYQLIWERFMASQMAPAIFDTTTIDFQLSPSGAAAQSAVRSPQSAVYLFRSTGSVIKFAGYLALYHETREPGEGRALEDEQALPVVEAGELVPVVSITPSQHFTEPPPRYSEASLVRELEKLGIGRPSTYASIISTILDRHYARLENRRFFPTPLGDQVEKVMVKQFPDIFNVRFTSHMEEDLDKVEEGEVDWRNMVGDFYAPFETAVKSADFPQLIAEAHDLSKLEEERCPECGGRLEARGGFFGPFVACENHPKNCKFTRPLRGDRKPAQMTSEICHECGAPMVIRHGRTGEFLGCSRFPKCRGTRSMPTGVKCPKDGGDLAVRRSKKRGKPFYGCSNYPECDFVVWDKPVPEECPSCGYVGAEVKSTKARGEYRRCIRCAHEWEVAPAEPREAEAVAV